MAFTLSARAVNLIATCLTIIRAGSQNTHINYAKPESNVNNTTIIKTTKLNIRTIITVIVIITACVVLSQ